MTDHFNKSASQIAAEVRIGQVTATQVTKSHLARLDALNPTLNAVVQDCASEALETAAAIDATLAAGGEVGPMAGVPVTTKVNADQKGHATTNGLRMLENLTAEHDSPVVQNLRRAGAVIVGRTNTPAFSIRWFTDNLLHGQTLNPHGAEITPGGSSGGAASAVAAGICAIGHGTDIGGSIRYPAYACGLHGLRPTLGRIPAFNASGAERHIGGQLMAVSGPIARTMDDIELSLAAMAAPSARDPWYVPTPLQGPVYSRHVALNYTPDGMEIATEVRTALTKAAQTLEAAGWCVEEVETPPLRPAAEINAQLWMAEMRKGAAKLVAQEDEPHSKFVFEHMLARSPEIEINGLLDALQNRATHIRNWQEFCEKYPVVLCPTSGQIPFTQQQDIASPDGFEQIMQSQLTQLGLPAIGLPGLHVATGFAAGRPMGVQLIAGRYREDILIAAGRALEAAHPAIRPVTPGT